MAYLVNDPNDFTDELIDGFVAANSDIIRRVPGGVARAHRSAVPAVSVVVGGGSGHYPAFGGLVGHGLADGAAMGNIFASPSAQQVYSVSKAVQRGEGVLLTYGNYAGDVLNFNRAQERLREEGIDTRTVVVTDDISSASPEEITKRRGIAGDLTVFKCAAAAAEAGYSLDEVERVARHANDRTRSIGVAFTGCSLPGAEEPLFTVPEGKMAVGMGIHGEPGISEVDVPTADELAQLLVDHLMAEIPEGVSTQAGGKLVVLVNGLGSVKYEELFVLYRRVAELLEGSGLVVVEPEVGELVTSFEMAGASLTFFWLDDELEQLWGRPAYTPAYRKGSLHTALAADSADEADAFVEQIPDATEASRAAAARAVEAVRAIVATIDENVDELGRLDSIAGDGDHGIGMQRGAHAALAEAERVAALPAGLGTLLALTGAAWADRAGGTSGALWGEIFTTVGQHVGDTDAPTAAVLAEAVVASAAAVTRYGGAQVGDKTLLDTLVPFGTALTEAAGSAETLAAAWAAGVAPARAAAASTADLLPRVGRARPHMEKSLGTPDPGALSMALIISAISDTLTN